VTEPEGIDLDALRELDHPRRNFSSWRWFRRNLELTAVDEPCPVDGGADAIKFWRLRLAARMAHTLGPTPEPVPLAVEVLDSVDCGSYRRDHVVYDSEQFMSVPAYLLVPHDRTTPGPAMLAVHGHGPGKDETCRVVEPKDRQNGYGADLAERGYVVLAPDLRTFGERAEWNPPDIYACNLQLVQASMLGFMPLALDLWDLARGLDLLTEHPLVDPWRIGMAGLSFGGTCTLFLAALDERVAAAVVSCYFNAWHDCAPIPWNMCGSQVAPGIVTAFDHADLAAAVAPRPLLVESGTEDVIFPVDAARREMAIVRQVYAALDAAACVEHDVFDGGHRFNGERAYPFLERFLWS
jgi:dienelactone hydrolase